ncbi:DEAD-box ATP-dependent RNA helicase 53, mitochondrial-like protein [Tanacetum coccineum]
MIGRARTRTGKTLAFGIPILDKTNQYNKKHGCETLLLLLRTSKGKESVNDLMAPTKQLAHQVGKEFVPLLPELDILFVGDSNQKLADGITTRQSDMTETNALATEVEYLLIYKFSYRGKRLSSPLEVMKMAKKMKSQNVHGCAHDSKHLWIYAMF